MSPPQPSSARSASATTTTTTVSSVKQDLLAKAQPELRDALASFPGLDHIVDTHDLVLQRVAAALGVAPARTRHTGDDGVLLLSSLQPGKAANYFRTYRAEPAVPAMVQSFATFETPGGVRRIYTKTGVCTPDNVLTPHLDIQMGANSQELIFNAGLTPKLNLVSHLEYIERYYNQPPPQAPARGDQQQQPQQQPGSFSAVEAEAGRNTQLFTPTVAPWMWARAVFAGALSFKVPIHGERQAEALAAVRRYALAVTDIWVAHALHDTASGAGDAAAQGPGVLEECKLATRVLRNYVGTDPKTPLLVPVFGEKAVQAWVETVAGEV